MWLALDGPSVLYRQPIRWCRAVAQGLRRRVLFSLRTAVASLLLASTVAVAAPSGPGCKQRLLEEMGWRFVPVDATSIQITAGTPCDRAGLHEAHAAGDLVVRVPNDLDADARARLSDELLHHPATSCA